MTTGGGLRRDGLLNLADLDNTFAIEVFPLIFDEGRRCCGHGLFQVRNRRKKQMADRMKVQWDAWREGGYSSVNFYTEQTIGTEKLSGEPEVGTQVVVPVKSGVWIGRIHYAETNHARKYIRGGGWLPLKTFGLLFIHGVPR